MTAGSIASKGTDDLLSGQWTVLPDNVQGTGEALEIPDPEAAHLPRYFHRIVVLP